MRRNLLIIMFALLLLGGCKKDKDVHVAKVQAETPDVTTTANAATISGTYSYASTLKSVVIVYGKDASLSSPQKVTAEHTRDSYSVRINNLDPSTKYYYYCIFDTGYGASEGEQESFTTQSVSATVVTTSSVSNITHTTATCGGNVTSDGGATVTARGVCWSTSQNPTVSDSHTTNGSGTGSFTSSITGLTANTKYYVRAYATNSAGTSYGEQRTFTTQGGGGTQTTPTVTTSSVSNITQTTATCGGNVTSDGGATVTARGVCWSTSQNPTVSNSHTTNGSGTGSFTSNITGLTANTTYYVRAYATNSAGTSYGEQKSFTTSQSISVPTVTTVQVSNITQTTATCGGNVTSDGGTTVTARGVCWSTSQNPTVSNSHTTNGSGTGSFTSSITGLTANTTYYVRAYATNSAGTSYGEQKSFTTLQSISVPTVTTSSVSNITQTTATCGGNVTSDGGAAVTARGVCWSTSQNPTVSNSHTTNGSGTGTFTSSITGLTANTKYYVRAYATNSKGTSYGEQKSFTTQSGGIGDHEYVDLGLPSGLLWATCNVGADSPEEYGSYFAWGETESKSTYSWFNYQWCNGSENTLTKYNTLSNYGIVDNKTVLEPGDDAAHVKWGGSWRMPTYDEMQELTNTCTWTWTTQNGVSGLSATGPNGNSIFLPVAGYFYIGGFGWDGFDGLYWSSSLFDTDYTPNACILRCNSNSVFTSFCGRCCGLSVRPVCPSQK